jgi:glycosyltransferase involved in cell wall biosynthesis
MTADAGAPQRRPRILALVYCYLPGFKSGGPVRSLAGLVDQLGDQFDIWIVTRDRDKDDAPYDTVRRGAWQRVGGANVYYARPEELTLAGIRRILRGCDFDLLYLNSFFNPLFTIRPLVLRRLGLIARRPAIIAPRGELAKAAKGLKWLRKRVYFAMAKATGLLRGLSWQASTASEADEIRRHVGPSPRVTVARNHSARGVVPALESRPAKRPGALRIVMLSRIAPMKNLLYALECLQHVDGDVEMDLYGPIDDPDYWAKCQPAIRAMPPAVRVRHLGSVPHAQARETIANYDLFFLPTLNENFGHAILDALVAGCPVLISQGTPWRRLAEHGVGWDIPLDDRSAMLAALQRAIAADAPEWTAMRERAQQFGLQHANDIESRQQNLELFRGAMPDADGTP